MFAVYLDDPGPNRLAAMKALRSALGVSIVEAKRLIESSRPMLRSGTKEQAEWIRNEIVRAGANASIEYYWIGIDLRSWIPPSHSADQVHCIHCGAKLLLALPGLTSEEQIRDFALACNFDNAQEIYESGWIHPGVFCPNSCCFALFDDLH